MKDWTGNKMATFATLGASNHSKMDRADYDYYATEPRATELLLELEEFNQNIWEPACGEMHIATPLEKAGYEVYKTDIIERAYKIDDHIDFLKHNGKWDGDIITNPPYKDALSFVKKALEVVDEGSKVAMFLKIQFLEGKARGKFFRDNPPKTVYVSTSRLNCVRNAEFTTYKSSAICYCWFIWEKGFKGIPLIKWFNG